MVVRMILNDAHNHSAHSQMGDDEYYNVVRATVIFLFMLTFCVLFCLRFFVEGEQGEARQHNRRGEESRRPGGSYDSFKSAPPLNDYFAPARRAETAEPAVVVSAVPCVQTGLVPTTSASWPNARSGGGGWWARREAYPAADF